MYPQSCSRVLALRAGALSHARHLAALGVAQPCPHNRSDTAANDVRHILWLLFTYMEALTHVMYVPSLSGDNVHVDHRTFIASVAL